MGRYTSLFEGMEIVKISDVESGYVYYGYSRWGRNEWAITRQSENATDFDFAIGKGSFDNAWTSRASKNYKKPSDFNVNP